MAKSGRQRRQRLEDEPPRAHAGMRNDEVGLFHHLFSVKQKVQIHRSSGSRRVNSRPPQVGLDRLQVYQERAGRERRLDLRHPVQEGTPGNAFRRRGLDEGGGPPQGRPRKTSEAVQCRGAVRRAIAQVGANGDIRPDAHGRVISTETPPITFDIGGWGFVTRTVTCSTENRSRRTVAIRSANLSRSLHGSWVPTSITAALTFP